MMGSEIEDWLARALEADPAERPEIRQEASKALPEAAFDEFEALLNGVESAPDFLEDPVEIDLVAADGQWRTLEAGGETPQLEIGSLVGGGSYAVRGVLGVGASSRVYDAEQDVPRRRIALKILRNALDERGARRFREEAETLAKLEHPHIARVLDAGVEQHEGRPLFWTALEQVRDPETITDFAEQQGLSTRARVELCLQVCDALHHAHRRGVLHRDVKPANILVPRSGEGGARLIDFGIARTSAFPRGTELERTRDGDLLGSLPWMSPEHASGRNSTLDVRSDVYSLGVVFWELLVGRRPLELEGLGLVDALERIRHGERDPDRVAEQRLDPDLAAVLRKCVEKEPELRYDSVAELAEDLRAFLAGRPVSASRPSWARRLKLYARRRPGVVGAAALGVLAVVGFSIGMTVLWIQSSDRARRLELAEEQRETADQRERDATLRASALLAMLEELGTDNDPLIDSFVNRVRSSVRSAEDREARRDVIAGAIEELEAMAAGDLEDAPTALQLPLARAFLRIGVLHGSDWRARGKDVEASARAFEQASLLWRRVVEAAPEVTAYRRMLVEALVEHVQAARKLNKQESAYDDSEEAVQIARQLVAERGSREHRRLLISALWARGDIRIWKPPYGKAIVDSREALELARELDAESPKDAGSARLVAYSAMRLALWEGPVTGKLDLVLALHRESIEAAIRCYELTENRTQIGNDLHMLFRYEIDTLGKMDRAEEIWGVYERLDRLLENERKDPDQAVNFLFTCDSTRNWMNLSSQLERADEIVRRARARVELVGGEAVREAFLRTIPELPPQLDVPAMLGRLGVDDLVSLDG